jgi:hypothetical protein
MSPGPRASRGRTRAPVEQRSEPTLIARSPVRAEKWVWRANCASASGCLLSVPQRPPVERDGPAGTFGHLAEGPDGPSELGVGGVSVERPLDGGVPPRPDGAVEGNARTDPCRIP